MRNEGIASKYAEIKHPGVVGVAARVGGRGLELVIGNVKQKIRQSGIEELLESKSKDKFPSICSRILYANVALRMLRISDLCCMNIILMCKRSVNLE